MSVKKEMVLPWLNGVELCSNSMKFLLLILTLLLSGCIPHNIDTARFDIQGGKTPLHSSILNDKEEVETAFSRSEIKPEKRMIRGVVTPHHILAINTMADLFVALSKQNYSTVVIIGPNHFNVGEADVIISEQGFNTPYGVLAGSPGLSSIFAGPEYIDIEEEPFDNEHSITSLVSLVKKNWPKAKFMPVLLRRGIDSEIASQVGYRLSKLLPEDSLVIASCDFAHHVSNEEAVEYDKGSIKVLEAFDTEGIKNIEVDSPGTLMALMSYLKQYDFEKFTLVGNTNASFILDSPEYDDVTSYIAGFYTEVEPTIVRKVVNKEKKEDIKMLFAGDLMLDRYVLDIIKVKGIDHLLEDLAGSIDLSTYDIVSANLEGAVADGGAHYDPVKAYDFSFDPQIVEKLKDYNFNHFNLANNHINDQGSRGQAETRKNLDDMGIYYSGCSEGMVGDCSGTTIKANDTKIGMLGLSAIYSNLDKEKLKIELKELEAVSDLQVANVHWGEEYKNDFSQKQADLAHFLIDEGVDVVIGHHPHVIQGIEVYKGKPIFYSLGNFIFDQYFSKETQTGLLVEINIVNNKLQSNLYPIISKVSRVSLLDTKEKERVLNDLVKYSNLNKKYSDELIDGRLVIEDFEN